MKRYEKTYQFWPFERKSIVAIGLMLLLTTVEYLIYERQKANADVAIPICVTNNRKTK